MKLVVAVKSISAPTSFTLSSAEALIKLAEGIRMLLKAPGFMRGRSLSLSFTIDAVACLSGCCVGKLLF